MQSSSIPPCLLTGARPPVAGLQLPARPPLTTRQQQAVGNLLRVQALVAQFVAKHDEDRIMVGRNVLYSVRLCFSGWCVAGGRVG